ncbi:hypothetical protein GOODEAATRI_029956 [Goodea atripinnis]|uniref:Uncharacterized protein n=1 Tax=Goodea atripinnis TaxID=208336 RepID=A0ABV0MX24_9TELE
MENFELHVTPATSKMSLPTIIRLYPPTAKPLHMHANMPLRFGRDSNDERVPNSSPNMPQRFGRSWEVMCGECREVRDAPSPLLPQRFGRNVPYWSLLRTLASEHMLDTGLHWVQVPLDRSNTRFLVSKHSNRKKCEFEKERRHRPQGRSNLTVLFASCLPPL